MKQDSSHGDYIDFPSTEKPAPPYRITALGQHGQQSRYDPAIGKWYLEDLSPLPIDGKTEEV